MSSETTGLTRALLPAVRPRTGAAAARLRAVLAGGAWAEIGLAAAVLVCLMLVRTSLFSWQSDDYLGPLKDWYGYLQAHGFAGLGDEFANYNVPYLYLLLVGTLFHVDSLVWIKAVSSVADVAMAAGCFAVLRHFAAPRRLAFVGAAAAMLLPEVLLNSAAWGQADSLYTAVLIWCLYTAFRARPGIAWALFALALSIKLQAAFFLPALVIVHLTRRWSFRGPLIAVGVFLLTWVPALVAGRSVESLATVYVKQTGEFALLTMNAPTLYALLPEAQHDLMRSSGMYLALACTGLLTYVVLTAARRSALGDRAVLLTVASIGALATWTLPMMHERYFFTANVLLFVYAVLERRALPWAVLAQLIAFSTYCQYLFHVSPVVPLQVLAVAQGAVVYFLIRELLRLVRPAGAWADGRAQEASAA